MEVDNTDLYLVKGNIRTHKVVSLKTEPARLAGWSVRVPKTQEREIKSILKQDTASSSTLVKVRRLKAGYLHKQKQGDTKWKKRWFEIVDHFLNYYKKEPINEADSPPAASIDLCTTDEIILDKSAEKSEKGYFTITMDDKTYNIKAENRSDAESWIKAMKDVKQHGGRD